MRADLRRFTERMLGARETLFMSDEPNIYTDNISRAGVTGKIPNAAKTGPRQAHKPAKMTRARRGHARKLRKRGLISADAATRNGL